VTVQSYFLKPPKGSVEVHGPFKHNVGCPHEVQDYLLVRVRQCDHGLNNNTKDAR